MTKGTQRCHNAFRIDGFPPQIFTLAAGIHDEFYFS
jgi:hypothetical protein